MLSVSDMSGTRRLRNASSDKRSCVPQTSSSDKIHCYDSHNDSLAKTMVKTSTYSNKTFRFSTFYRYMHLVVEAVSIVRSSFVSVNL